MREHRGVIGWLHVRWIGLYTRRCRPGCQDPSVHDGHLTWLGVLHYIHRYRLHGAAIEHLRRVSGGVK